MIRILGALGTIENLNGFIHQIHKFASEHEVIIQVFNADVIYNEAHLISATKHALRAFERKMNTTNSLEMEIMLYASGERQLKLAIPKVGVVEGEGRIAFVIVDSNKKQGDKSPNYLINKLLRVFSLEMDNTVLEGNVKKLKRFGVTDQEIKTVEKHKYGDLILEKIALVDIIK